MGSTDNAVIYILGAALAGGALTVLYNAYRRWRSGPLDDRATIASTLQNDMGTLRQLLEQYRVEVELNRRQLEDYREQLHEVTRELAGAQVRIERLERQLDRAQGDTARLQHELSEATRRRDELEHSREQLVEDVAHHRARIDDLERQLGLEPRPA